MSLSRLSTTSGRDGPGIFAPERPFECVRDPVGVQDQVAHDWLREARRRPAPAAPSPRPGGCARPRRPHGRGSRGPRSSAPARARWCRERRRRDPIVLRRPAIRDRSVPLPDRSPVNREVRGSARSVARTVPGSHRRPEQRLHLRLVGGTGIGGHAGVLQRGRRPAAAGRRRCTPSSRQTARHPDLAGELLDPLGKRQRGFGGGRTADADDTQAGGDRPRTGSGSASALNRMTCGSSTPLMTPCGRSSSPPT